MHKLILDVDADRFALLQQTAAGAGQTVEQYVHDVVVADATEHAFVTGAAEEAERVLPGVTEEFPEGQR